MSLNKISAAVAPETEEGVIQRIKEARGLLSFLVDLTSKERIRMSKLSRRFVDFVDRGLLHAKANPQYVPLFISVEEFTKDVELRDSLLRMYAEANGLIERLRDTLLLVESEAYQTARVFYKSVKSAAKEGADGAEQIAKDLAYHYKKKRSEKNETDGDESQEEPAES